jgi:hypothetical protein
MADEQHVGEYPQPLFESPLAKADVKDFWNGWSQKAVQSCDLQRRCSVPSLPRKGSLPARKNTVRPQLPCFKGLGISSISAPLALDSSRPRPGSSLSAPEVTALGSNPGGYGATSSAQMSTPRNGSTPLLTPPEEIDSMKWTTSSSASFNPNTTAFQSITIPASIDIRKPECASVADHSDGTGNVSFEEASVGASESLQSSEETSMSQAPTNGDESNAWLDQSVGAAGKFICRSYLAITGRI